MSMLPDATARPSPDTVRAAENSGISSPDTMIGAVPRFPPSTVRTWFVCPRFSQLSKRWEPRVDEWTPHRLVGTAIHAGIETWLRPQIDGSASPDLDPLDVALGALADGYVQQEAWGLEGLQALVKKGYQKLRGFIDAEILPGARVVAVEYADPCQDPRFGTHRIHRVVDCILERDGALEVWDWKTKIRLDEAYLHETSRATLHSWQLLDYSWHVRFWEHEGRFLSEHEGRFLSTRDGGRLPVLPDRASLPAPRPVRYAAHGLVILGPKLMAKAIPIALTHERLTQWRSQADRVWRAMWECDQQDGPAVMNWEACSDRHLHYGKECQFVPACHLLHGNEAQFSGVYQRKVIDGLLHPRQD